MSKIFLVAYVIITSSALVALKYGAKDGALFGFESGKVNINPTFFSLLGFVLYGVSFVIYTYLLSKYDLGYLIPITSALVYSLIFIASYFIFKETFTLIKIIGIMLILLGLIMLNLGSRK